MTIVKTTIISYKISTSPWRISIYFIEKSFTLSDRPFETSINYISRIFHDEKQKKCFLSGLPPFEAILVLRYTRDTALRDAMTHFSAYRNKYFCSPTKCVSFFLCKKIHNCFVIGFCPFNAFQKKKKKNLQ